MLTNKITKSIKPRKSSPRLKNFDYEGNYCYFITCCTHQSKPYFKDKNLVNLILNTLRETVQKEAFTILSYCFMPDHLHLLLLGNGTSSLKNFMRHFKQKSSFYFRRISKKTLWQRSYYDHILRKEEDIKEIVLYILRNPIRKGLVSYIRDYPFLGSDMFDCNQLE